MQRRLRRAMSREGLCVALDPHRTRTCATIRAHIHIQQAGEACACAVFHFCGFLFLDIKNVAIFTLIFTTPTCYCCTFPAAAAECCTCC